jgi:hypothetical protein
MWILKFIPDFIIYLIPLLGMIGLLLTYFIRFIPGIYIYKTQIQLASVSLLIVGSFLCGINFDNNQWLAKVKEMEEKVAQAEQQSKEANIQIETKIVKEKAKIVEKQVLVKEFIDREVIKYDSQCVIPKEFVEAHNKAAAK